MKMNKILLVVALLVSVNAAQASIKDSAQRYWQAGYTKAASLYSKIHTPATVTNVIESVKKHIPEKFRTLVASRTFKISAAAVAGIATAGVVALVAYSKYFKKNAAPVAK